MCLLGKLVEKANFLNYIVFSDECIFRKNRLLNIFSIIFQVLKQDPLYI